MSGGESNGSPPQPTGRYALLGTGLLYLVVFALDPGLARAAVGKSLDILGQIAPVLVLVTGLVGVSKYRLSPAAVAHHVGAESGARGYLVAAAGGIASHGPVYAWYALLQDLQAAGMRNGLIAVFLYNRAIKLPLLPLLLVYFGLRYAVVLLLIMTLFSILQGLLVDRLVPPVTRDRG
jgi:uncharacterized membrane protein YraQ (UPF0718 family)